jgi:hypothetical protein
MTQVCPLCGTANEDSAGHCSSCGNPLVLSAREASFPARVLPAFQPGRKNRLIAIAAGAVIVTLAILLALQAAGIVTGPPFPSPSGTPRIPPVTTRSDTAAPPLPQPTPLTVMTTVVSITTEYSTTRPASTETITCSPDQRACGTNCTDIRTDPGNCGACGVPCIAGQICQGGHCITKCDEGEVACFNSCHNLSYDAQNCGICGNSCPVGLTCNRSICSPTLATTIPTYAG